jgi:hypothetical protein
VRELHEQSTSVLVWALVLLAAALSGLWTRVGVEAYRSRLADYGQLVDQRTRDQARQDGRVLGWALEPGLRALRPPEPSTVIVAGLDGSLPQFWDFTPAGVRAGRSLPERSDLSDTAGTVDFEFAVRVLLGALAVLLALQSVAGERASGALLAVLGQPVRPSAVLAGKLASGAITLAGAVAIVVSVTALTIALTAPDLISAPFLASLSALWAASLLYLLACFSGGLLIASAVPFYTPALIAAVLLWILSAFVALPLGGLLARALSPVSPRSLVEARTEELAAHGIRVARIEMGDVYLEVLGSRSRWRAIETDPMLDRAVRQAVEPVYQRHTQALRTELDRVFADADRAGSRHKRVIEAVSLASPAAQFTAAATAIAGTGQENARRWEEATAGQQSRLNSALFDDWPRLTFLVAERPGLRPDGAGRAIHAFQRRAAPSIQELPHFVPPPAHPSLRFADALPHLLVLTAYAILFAIGASVAFHRIRF